MAESIIEQRLRIVPEFRPEEYAQVTEILSGKLDRRLSRWDAEQVELELSVKDRDTNSQRAVLECWISGLPKFVATSTERDLDAAVTEVRDDLFVQINRHVDKTTDQRRR
ncbi:HPF/RaiA family ribosome-associated protein [Nitriliruptoraceae bacterium ZYF776]|nr:HPF/RaiA family ribosome-associated protein [Profundirhabdus halotolerans]